MPRFALLLLLALPPVCAQTQRDLISPVPIPDGSTLVVGFLGGFEPWNDEHRGIRKLILKLRREPGVFAESVGNHHRKVALQYIRRAVRNRPSARIILIGQSWGGAAAIATARDLQRFGIPILLTVQIDSVGARDAVIPANVAVAVNFYQHDLLTIRGRGEIRAADPSRTRILGNFGFTYPMTPSDSPDASWGRRTLGGSHAKMELDPEVWARVEQYVREAIRRR